MEVMQRIQNISKVYFRLKKIPPNLMEEIEIIMEYQITMDELTKEIEEDW
jgi:5-bromo-4-chloroindolyl phosphate hydrolysis protein